MTSILEDKSKLQSRLLESVNHPLIATTLKGEIIYWNKAAEKMYGWKEKQVLGKNIVDITPTDSTKEQAVEIMEALQKGKTWTGEFTVKRKNGTSFSALISDSPIQDEKGKLVGIVGITTDITEKNKKEEQLEKKNEELKKMNQAMVGRELKMVKLKEKIASLQRLIEDKSK